MSEEKQPEVRQGTESVVAPAALGPTHYAEVASHVPGRLRVRLHPDSRTPEVTEQIKKAVSPHSCHSPPSSGLHKGNCKEASNPNIPLEIFSTKTHDPQLIIISTGVGLILIVAYALSMVHIWSVLTAVGVLVDHRRVGFLLQ